MTTPFTFNDLLNDPEFEKEFTSTPLGKRDALRARAAVRRQEIAAAIREAQSSRPEGAAADRTSAWIAEMQDELKRIDTMLSTGRRVTKATENRSAAENLGRGALAGFARAIPDAADLALAIPDRLGVPGAGAARSAVQNLAEAQSQVFDPQGGAGTVGEVAGGIVGGAPVYGRVASAIGRRGAEIAAARGAGSLAKLLSASVDAEAPLLRQAVGNAVAGTPLNVLSQIAMDPETSAGDRGKNALIQTGADFLAPLLLGGAGRALSRTLPEGRTQADLPKVRGEPEVNPEAAAAAPKGSPVPGSADDILTSLKGKGKERETQQAERKELKSAYKEAEALAPAQEWEAANPGMKWAALTQEQRKTIRAAWKEANPYDKWLEANRATVTGTEPVPAVEPAVAPVGDPVPVRTDEPAGGGIPDNGANAPVQAADVPPDVAPVTFESWYATTYPDQPLNTLTRATRAVAEEEFRAAQAGQPIVPGPAAWENNPTPVVETPVVAPVEVPPPAVVQVPEPVPVVEPPPVAEVVSPVVEVAPTPVVETPGADPILDKPPGAPPVVTEPPAIDGREVSTWWNKLRPQARQQVLLSASKGEGFRQVHADMRWVALPDRAKRAVMEAYEAQRAIETAPKVTAPPTAQPQPAPIQPPNELAGIAFKDLQKLSSKTWSLLDKLDKTDPRYAQALRVASAVSDEIARRPEYAQVRAESAKDPIRTARAAGPGDPTLAPTKAAPKADAAPSPVEIDPGRAVKPKDLKTDELPAYISHFAKLAAEEQNFGKRGGYQKRVKALTQELQDRNAPHEMRVQTTASVVGGAAGLLYGNMQPADSDEQRARNGLMWAAAGALAGWGLQRVVEFYSTPRVKTSGSTELTTPLSDKVVSMDNVKQEVKVPFTEKLREFYNGTVRQTANLERILDDLSKYNHAAAERVRQYTSLFGYYISNNESWLHDRPVIRGRDGEPQFFDALGMQSILQIANGDKEGLGNLATALSALELHYTKGMKNLPVDLDWAETTVKQAPQHMIQAATELRRYNAALVDAMVSAGRISPAAAAVMKSEQWYTPFYRILSNGQERNLRDFKRGRLNAPDPVKGREGGSKLSIINPVDQTIALTPRFLRAVEFNQLVQSLVDVKRSIGDEEVADSFMKLVKPTKEQYDAIRQVEKDAADVALQLGLKAEDVGGLINSTALEQHPAFRDGVITHWENGQIYTYKVHSAVFETMKSLLPMEQDLLTNLFARAGRGVSKGVVNSPVFLFNQLFKDSFEASVMSRYGFRPGWDTLRGWWSIVSRDENYKRMLQMGGPGTIQSLKYLDPETALKAIETEGGNALSVAWKQMKQLEVVDAYKTLALPMGEAARVGEYLRALDHGETTLNAVYAAWNVLGNTRMQGNSILMRKLYQMIPFARAGVAATDEMLFRAGIHPFRTPQEGRLSAGVGFLTRGMGWLGIPSLTLWAAQKDDEQLREFRNTRVGQHYWFIRPSNFIGTEAAEEAFGNPDQILRIPKPHAAGVFFGSMVERAADLAAQKDPQATDGWAKALLSQVAVNMLPTVGAVPIGLWTNYDFGKGGPIISDAERNMDPTIQGHDTASLPARVVGSFTGKVGLSAPKIDYLVRNLTGMAGDDVLTAVSQAGEYFRNGYVPARHELPMMKQFFVNEGSTNVAPVERFYKYAQRAEEVYFAGQHLLRDDPQAFMAYYREHAREYALAGTMNDARKSIADLRRASQTIRMMGRDRLSTEEKQRYTKTFNKQIIDYARMTSEMWEAFNSPE